MNKKNKINLKTSFTLQHLLIYVGLISFLFLIISACITSVIFAFDYLKSPVIGYFLLICLMLFSLSIYLYTQLQSNNDKKR